MITYSTFMVHFTHAQNRMARADVVAVRDAARARLADRWIAGRGEGALDFTDLCMRIEDAIGPRTA